MLPSEDTLLLLPKPIYTLFYQISQAKLSDDDSYDLEKFSKMYINLLNISYLCLKGRGDFKILGEACDFIINNVQIEYRKNVWFVKVKVLAQMDAELEKIL